MERKIILKDPEKKKEMTLPVTPESYEVSTSMGIELVNIHGLGDAVFSGNSRLGTFTLNVLLPSTRYDFASSKSPQPYIRQLTKWCEGKAKLRFLVKGAKVNIPVMLESVSYGEQDGTNDIYAEISLREYRPLKAVQVQKKASDSKKRDSQPEKEQGEVSYTAVYGDTLCSICRKYYGDDSKDIYTRLAAYNGKANPNLLMTGEVIRIPRPLP